MDIRACRPQELERFFRTCEAAFGYEPTDEEMERFGRLLPAERAFAAFDGDDLVGTTGSFPFSLTVPGGEVAAGGVTMVGVLPSHRRRGILTEMMASQLLDARDRREAVAVLWASEGAIYQRFGYGSATRQAEVSIERDRARFTWPGDAVGRCRLLSLEEATKTLPDVYERVRAVTPGMYARSNEWWQSHTLADPETDRRGGGPMFRVVWEIDGQAGAYALYRLHGEWTDGLPAGWLEVREAIATSPLATRELWRFLLGVDLVQRVHALALSAHHPLFLMVTEPRRLHLAVKDALWLRIVDVAEALEARSYVLDATLVFELVDPVCPWNQGRWRLEASGGAGRLSASDAPAELRMTAADLGSVYLGGTSFRELVEAGRVEELVEGAALEATLLFTSERAPWCPEIF
jgi:predicted acetyltransferase